MEKLYLVFGKFITGEDLLFPFCEDFILLGGLSVVTCSIISFFLLKSLLFNFQSSLNMFAGPKMLVNAIFLNTK